MRGALFSDAWISSAAARVSEELLAMSDRMADSLDWVLGISGVMATMHWYRDKEGAVWKTDCRRSWTSSRRYIRCRLIFSDQCRA